MKVFAISDTHFGHDKLSEVFGRPVDFGERILSNLSKSKGDILIHCGDFCIGDDEIHHDAFMECVSGFDKLILVRGNHDKKSDAWYMAHGWDFVCEILWQKYFGKQIIFSHMPILKPPEDTFSPHFPPDINIHGHLHGDNDRRGMTRDLYDTKWFYDLAPDTNDYKPVDVESIIHEIYKI